MKKRHVSVFACPIDPYRRKLWYVIAFKRDGDVDWIRTGTHRNKNDGYYTKSEAQAEAKRIRNGTNRAKDGGCHTKKEVRAKAKKHNLGLKTKIKTVRTKLK